MRGKLEVKPAELYNYIVESMARHLCEANQYSCLRCLFDNHDWMRLCFSGDYNTYRGYISDLILASTIAFKLVRLDIKQGNDFVVDPSDCIRFTIITFWTRWNTGAEEIYIDIQGEYICMITFLDKLESMTPEKRQFFLTQGALHLANGDKLLRLKKLLMNFDYLQSKLNVTDTNALSADCDFFPNDRLIQALQSAVRMSAHITQNKPERLLECLSKHLAGYDNVDPEFKILFDSASSAALLSNAIKCCR